MYIYTLVEDVRHVLEDLKSEHGNFLLAMLYNSGPLQATSNWNLIISAPWTDRMGSAGATRLIATALSESLEVENKSGISRITVLKTSDPFVRDMTKRYPIAGPGVPLNTVTAGPVSEGSAFVLYSLTANSMIPG